MINLIIHKICIKFNLIFFYFLFSLCRTLDHYHFIHVSTLMHRFVQSSDHCLRAHLETNSIYIRKDTGREKREWIPDVSQRESVEWIPQEDNRDNRRRNSFPAKKSDHVRRNNDRLARTWQSHPFSKDVLEFLPPTSFSSNHLSLHLYFILFHVFLIFITSIS